MYNKNRMFIIDEFKHKSFYESMIKKTMQRITDIDSEIESLQAVQIKEVIIENGKGFNMDNVHKVIEDKKKLENTLEDFRHRLSNVMTMYNMVKNDEVKRYIELLYFNHVYANDVAEANFTTIGAMYHKINCEVDRILKSFYEI